MKVKLYLLFYIASIVAMLFFSKLQVTNSLYYLIFIALYTIICVFCRKLLKNQEINPVLLVIFALPILSSEPFFENDHYRYLWEGKVLAAGENPYTQAPNNKNLKKIRFEKKSKIGFTKLSSIYPPLSLMVFASVSKFSYKKGLAVLQFLNILLFAIFVSTLIFHYKVNSFYLTLLFPFFVKEFMQAIHIDFLAIVLLLLFYTSKKMHYSFLSFWVKFISILTLPFEYIRSNEKISLLKLMSIIIISSMAFLYFSQIPLFDFSGPNIFVKKWIWMPGALSILNRLSPESTPINRVLTICFFGLSYIIIFLRFYKKKITKFHALFLVFSSLMFFSPVYNGWYAIWPLTFALIISNPIGITYALMSAVCYISYGNEYLRSTGEIIVHLPYWYLIYKEIKDYSSISNGLSSE